MSDTQTAPKATRKLKAPTKAAAPKAAAAPKVEKVAKPSVMSHKFGTDYSGASGPLNARPSKTAIDFGKFGSLLDAALTDRDRKSLASIRREFQKKTFVRANVDAGILRRLGERGLLEHVGGSNVAPDATFKLTARAFSKDAMAA